MRYVSAEARRTVLVWFGWACLILVLLVAAVAWGGYRWLAYTGRQDPVASVAGPRASGLMVVEARPSDPGVQAFTRLVSEEMVALARARGKELPPMADRMIAQAGLEVVPAAASVAFEPVPGNAMPEPVAALNFPGHARLMGMVSLRVVAGSALGPNLSSERYRGYDVVGEGPVLCMHNGTLLLAASRDAMRATVDRLEDGKSQPPSLPSRLQGDFDFRGSFRNQGGMMTWLAEHLGGGAAVGDTLNGNVDSVEFGADLVSEDELRAVVLTRCRSAAATPSVKPAVRWVLDGFGRSMAEAGLSLSHESAVDGRDVRSDLVVTGVGGAVKAWFARVKEGQPGL